MRQKFIAGNWKMFTNKAGAKELAAAVAAGLPANSTARVAVFPPFPWLTTVAEVLKGSPIGLGAQNCAAENEGAFTGEVAPPMLVDAGCRYVIIGHSERRHGLNESDTVLNKKAKAALAAGLELIFCVGELLSEREGNRTESVLDTQLTFGLNGLTAAQMAKVVIAYEPVWAIGTGKVATPEQAQEAHAFIRGKIRKLFDEKTADSAIIQYGGSAKPENVDKLLSLPDVDGGLIGGASLKADMFLAIVKSVK